MPAWLPIANLGLSAIGSYLGFRGDKKNRQLQEQTNADNRQFQWDMYWRQREDALSDWNMVNQYNSPMQQMQRYKDAGLNPNLIYGQTNEAPMVRTSAAGQGNKIAPTFNPEKGLGHLTQGIMGTAQLRQADATLDQTAAQTDYLKKQAVYSDAQTAKLAVDTARSKFDLEQADRLKDLVVERAILENQGNSLRNDQTATMTQLALNKDQREQLLNAPMVSKAWLDIMSEKLKQAKTVEETNYIKEQIIQLQKIQTSTDLENQLKDFRSQLQNAGVDPNDPWYVRFFAQFWNRLLN